MFYRFGLVTTILSLSFFPLSSIKGYASQQVGPSKPVGGAQAWGRHTSKGWWNPHSGGSQPVTTINDYDYIVVGSGAGGAPLAARLGLAGHKVLVIEAGRDEVADNISVTVVIFNAKASEDERLLWAFYAATQIIAMIMMRPLDDDWNQIASISNDVQRGNSGHGYNGWLSTNRAELGIFLSDNKTYWMLKAAASLLGTAVNAVADLRATLARDLNDGKVERGTEKGLFNAPPNIDTYKRSSPRDFLLDTQRQLTTESAKPNAGRIDIRLDCLATRIMFAPGTTRAIGVEFLDGSHLYKADPKSRGAAGVPGVAFARKEILC